LMIAVARGKLETVRLILGLCQDSISWWCDRCGDTHTPAAFCPLGIKMSADSFIPKESSKGLLASNRNAQTPAMVAAAGSHAQVLEVLVQHASFATTGGIAAQDKDGYTVLHHAAKQKDAACVKFLLTLEDVPFGTQDRKKKTALDLAIDAGATDCASALRAYEAKGDALLRELLAEEEAGAGKSKNNKKKKNKSEPAASSAASKKSSGAEEVEKSPGVEEDADAAADGSDHEVASPNTGVKETNYRGERDLLTPETYSQTPTEAPPDNSSLQSDAELARSRSRV